jgi:hypothetical protein
MRTIHDGMACILLKPCTVKVARKTMERDGLAPTLIMTTGLQSPEVLQAATDAYAVTRVRTARSSRIGETCKGWVLPYKHHL